MSEIQHAVSRDALAGAHDPLHYASRYSGDPETDKNYRMDEECELSEKL